MSRLNVITPERMSPEQRKVYEESVAAGTPTGTTGGPYTAYIRNPEYMRLHREVANYLRRNSLPGRLRQMLVLRTIKHWGAKYPWVVQVRASLREGLEQSIVDAIDKGQNPALTSPQDIARCVADLFGFQLTGGRWNCSGKPEWSISWLRSAPLPQRHLPRTLSTSIRRKTEGQDRAGQPQGCEKWLRGRAVRATLPNYDETAPFLTLQQKTR